MKAAIIDLDGVVADNSRRFGQAEAEKQRYDYKLAMLLAKELSNPSNTAYVKKGVKDLVENLFWQVAFDPGLIWQDTIIDGAKEAIAQLEESGYMCYFLTSRPEHMRRATLQWMDAMLIPIASDDRLIMKAPALQFTKTTVWKAGMAQTIASLFGVTELLFIDDEQANIDEVLKYLDTRLYTINVYQSLHSALSSK